LKRMTLELRAIQALPPESATRLQSVHPPRVSKWDRRGGVGGSHHVERWMQRRLRRLLLLDGRVDSGQGRLSAGTLPRRPSLISFGTHDGVRASLLREEPLEIEGSRPEEAVLAKC